MLEQQSILELLQTFKVTARHLSFTLAAREMNLTPSAVNHRIRKLEMQIGFRLFIRLTRRLALTGEGKRLLATLSHSLRAINDEIEDIREQDLRGTLHVGIAPTLAHLWLAAATFIHAAESTEVQDQFAEWRLWCRQSGCDLPFDGRYYGVNNHSIAIRMAENGLGIVMGRLRLIQPLLVEGRLVRLSDECIASPFGYDPICPQEHRSRPRFRAFSDWLKSECRAD